jgi:hypothetical protein
MRGCASLRRLWCVLLAFDTALSTPGWNPMLTSLVAKPQTSSVSRIFTSALPPRCSSIPNEPRALSSTRTRAGRDETETERGFCQPADVRSPVVSAVSACLVGLSTALGLPP